MAPGTALPLHPDELAVLQRRVVRLETLARWRGRALAVTTVPLLGLGFVTAFARLDGRRQLESCWAKLVESQQAHSALASADGDGMAARASGAAKPTIDL